MSPSEALAALRQAVLLGEEGRATALAQQALAARIPPLQAIESALVPGIREAGRLFEEGEYFLPELVTAAQAMKAAMAILKPELSQTRQNQRLGRVVIGTVQGDIHDIGKTLVATLLSANGFEVSDEGGDVPVEQFIRRARELSADLICASALLTTTMVVQRELIQAVHAARLTAKVLVGGAPVTRAWAEQIGADGHADNAVGAVAEACRLVGHDETV